MLLTHRFVVVPGAYVELDQCSAENSKFVVTDHNHVIFIGIRTHPMARDKLGELVTVIKLLEIRSFKVKIYFFNQ